MEIERKWLIKNFPDYKRELKQIAHKRTMVAFISTNPEIRIVQIDDQINSTRIYNLCIKSHGDITREEFETQVPEDFAEDIFMWLSSKYYMIYKEYFVYEYEDRNIEFSIVDPGDISEFMYAEVEFSSEEEAISFEFPFPECEYLDVTSGFKLKDYWIEKNMINDRDD